MDPEVVQSHRILERHRVLPCEDLLVCWGPDPSLGHQADRWEVGSPIRGTPILSSEQLVGSYLKDAEISLCDTNE